MSEDLTQNALQEPSSPDQMAGPTEATTTEEAKHDSPSPAVEQFEVPKKFLKADGSPDYERMTKAYVNLERTWSKKPNLPPASPDDYIWEKEADANLDAERVTEFKRQLHEKGFTKDQYAFIMDNYQEVIGSLTWTLERTEEVMKQEWGKDFTENTKAARAGFEHFAPSDFRLRRRRTSPSVSRLGLRPFQKKCWRCLVWVTLGTRPHGRSIRPRRGSSDAGGTIPQ